MKTSFLSASLLLSQSRANPHSFYMNLEAAYNTLPGGAWFQAHPESIWIATPSFDWQCAATSFSLEIRYLSGGNGTVWGFETESGDIYHLTPSQGDDEQPCEVVMTARTLCADGTPLFFSRQFVVVNYLIYKIQTSAQFDPKTSAPQFGVLGSPKNVVLTVNSTQVFLSYEPDYNWGYCTVSLDRQYDILPAGIRFHPEDGSIEGVPTEVQDQGLRVDVLLECPEPNKGFVPPPGTSLQFFVLA